MTIGFNRLFHNFIERFDKSRSRMRAESDADVPLRPPLSPIKC